MPQAKSRTVEDICKETVGYGADWYVLDSDDDAFYVCFGPAPGFWSIKFPVPGACGRMDDEPPIEAWEETAKLTCKVVDSLNNDGHTLGHDFMQQMAPIYGASAD